MQPLSDEEIIEHLQSPDFLKNDLAMHYLYFSMYRKVVNFIVKNSGSEHEAADVFQDSLIAFYKLAKSNRLKEVKSLKAYFFSICKNLWYKTLQKKQKNTTLTEAYHSIPEEATQIQTLLNQEKKALINLLLDSIGESCRKVLVYYYYDRLKMKQIMTLMNFSSEQVAKNKKAACMKKLKEIIEKNPGLKDLLQ